MKQLTHEQHGLFISSIHAGTLICHAMSAKLAKINLTFSHQQCI
jgi:hypothetical protein